MDDEHGFARVASSAALGVVVMAQQKNDWKYEIRLCGEAKCTSNIQFCGLSVKTIRDMMAAGYQYLVDGKVVMKV